jgi:hypothetical protein
MSPRRTGRTQTCGPREAANRLSHAHSFLDVAELVATDLDTEGNGNVAASLAVLAGIAAADAASCARIGRRSRSQDHRDAQELVASVEPGGPDAANKLRRLLDLKDDAQYGIIDLGRTELRSALRQAKALVSFAEEIVTSTRPP